MAVAKAEGFSNHWGLEYVVDMDLSKCFDTLNHELIIKSVNKRINIEISKHTFSNFEIWNEASH